MSKLPNIGDLKVLRLLTEDSEVTTFRWESESGLLNLGRKIRLAVFCRAVKKLLKE